MTIDKALKILKARKGCIENNRDWCSEEMKKIQKIIDRRPHSKID